MQPLVSNEYYPVVQLLSHLHHVAEVHLIVLSLPSPMCLTQFQLIEFITLLIANGVAAFGQLFNSDDLMLMDKFGLA